MRIKSTALLLCVLLACGCSTTIKVTMKGKPNMNSGGNAAVVQVYELSGEGSFRDLSFRTFWRKEEVMSGKLVGTPQRKILYPNETTSFKLKVAKKTKFIGVAANLRNPEPEKWRALYPADKVGDQLSVTVYSNRISVEVEGKGALERIGISSR